MCKLKTFFEVPFDFTHAHTHKLCSEDHFSHLHQPKKKKFNRPNKWKKLHTSFCFSPYFIYPKSEHICNTEKERIQSTKYHYKLFLLWMCVCVCVSKCVCACNVQQNRLKRYRIVNGKCLRALCLRI